MTSARVLVVEDDPLIRSSVAGALAADGHAVEALADARELEEACAAFRPDLAVLDVMLPGVDGLTAARRMRRDADVPVLFLTALDAVDDRVAGFEAGGDDYVTKPFALEELSARVRALLRRRGVLPTTIDLGRAIVDEGAQRVVLDGADLDLTATELRLLVFLARHRGRVLSKTQLLTQVWGWEDYDVNLVEVHVSALRRKLGDVGPRMLRTVRGLGYVLHPVTDGGGCEPTAPGRGATAAAGPEAGPATAGRARGAAA